MAHRLPSEIWSVVTSQLVLEDQLALLDAAEGLPLGRHFASTHCFTSIRLSAECVHDEVSSEYYCVTPVCDFAESVGKGTAIEKFNEQGIFSRLQCHAATLAQSVDTLGVSVVVPTPRRVPSLIPNLKRHNAHLGALLRTLPLSCLSHVHLSIRHEGRGESCVRASFTPGPTKETDGAPNETDGGLSLLQAMSRWITHPDWFLTAYHFHFPFATVDSFITDTIADLRGLLWFVSDSLVRPRTPFPTTIISADPWALLQHVYLPQCLPLVLDDIVQLPFFLRTVRLSIKLHADAMSRNAVFTNTTSSAQRCLFHTLPYLRALDLGIVVIHGNVGGSGLAAISTAVNMPHTYWQTTFNALLDYVPPTLHDFTLTNIRFEKMDFEFTMRVELPEVFATRLPDGLGRLQLPPLFVHPHAGPVPHAPMRLALLTLSCKLTIDRNGPETTIQLLASCYPMLTHLDLTFCIWNGTHVALPWPLESLRNGLPHLRVLGLHSNELCFNNNDMDTTMTPWPHLQTLAILTQQSTSIAVLRNIAGPQLRLLSWQTSPSSFATHLHSTPAEYAVLQNYHNLALFVTSRSMPQECLSPFLPNDCALVFTMMHDRYETRTALTGGRPYTQVQLLYEELRVLHPQIPRFSAKFVARTVPGTEAQNGVRWAHGGTTNERHTPSSTDSGVE